MYSVLRLVSGLALFVQTLDLLLKSKGLLIHLIGGGHHGEHRLDGSQILLRGVALDDALEVLLPQQLLLGLSVIVLDFLEVFNV